MSATIYASSLGTCFAKSADGFFRLYKVNGAWAIYSVAKGDSGRLEAVFAGDILDRESFDYAVDLLEEESRCLAAEFAAEFF